jgi:hypothetical protein
MHSEHAGSTVLHGAIAAAEEVKRLRLIASDP